MGYCWPKQITSPSVSLCHAGFVELHKCSVCSFFCAQKRAGRWDYSSQGSEEKDTRQHRLILLFWASIRWIQQGELYQELCQQWQLHAWFKEPNLGHFEESKVPGFDLFSHYKWLWDMMTAALPALDPLFWRNLWCLCIRARRWNERWEKEASSHIILIFQTVLI